MAQDPKKTIKNVPNQSNPNTSTSKGKNEPAEHSGGMGGMIGEGRAEEGSRSGMKGEQ